jgi:hypothetical protein
MMDEIKNKKNQENDKKKQNNSYENKKEPNWIQKLNEIKCWRTKSKNQINLKAK